LEALGAPLSAAETSRRRIERTLEADALVKAPAALDPELDGRAP
jgi:hypothetical protein